MKKTSKIITAITMLCVLLLSGCGLGPHTETDYAAAIMVEGSIYLKSASAMPAESDESAIIGYTTSYTDSFPKKDGETNFNRELNMPYARVEGGIAVLYENQWYLCTPMEQNAVAPNKCQDKVAGNISFYEEPEREAQSFGGTVTIRLSRDLNEEQADKLKDILDDVDEWVDDHSVDRLAYYFDGDFELSDREHKYYFTYEYDVIYYDHYFAEIPAEDMQYIKDLGAECVELPDIETNSISFDDLAPGTETTFDTKIDVLTDNSELAYTLTYGRASISLEIGLRSEDGTELATEITGGDAKGVISNVPAGTYTVFLRNIEEVNQEVTETPNVTGALHFYIVELPGIERTDEPDEYPDTNIVPGFDLDEPYEPTEYTNYYDIEEQVKLCKGTADEKSKVTVKFQSTEGPSAFAIEVWYRTSENDEWTKSESKSALIDDAPAFSVPAASEYIVMVTATAGNKGNVTFFVSCS